MKQKSDLDVIFEAVDGTKVWVAALVGMRSELIAGGFSAEVADNIVLSMVVQASQVRL